MSRISAPSGAFTKGDPRASAAGRKSKRGPLPKVEKRFLDDLRLMTPDVLQAVKVKVAEHDPLVIRMLVDRFAPLQLTADIEVRDTIAALTAQIDKLTDELKATRKELAAATGQTGIDDNDEEFGSPDAGDPASQGYARAN